MREGGSLQWSLSWNTKGWGISYPLLVPQDHDSGKVQHCHCELLFSILSAFPCALLGAWENVWALRMTRTGHRRLEVVPQVHLSSCLSVRDTPHWKSGLPSPLWDQFQKSANYLRLHIRKLTNHPPVTGFPYTYLGISAALEVLAWIRSLRALTFDLHILLCLLPPPHRPLRLWGMCFPSFLNGRGFCDMISMFLLPCYL